MSMGQECPSLIGYGINCLEKSIKYWTYKLTQESEKCHGNEWDSSYEMLVYRQNQQKYLKDEIVKLKAIYNHCVPRKRLRLCLRTRSPLD